MNDHGQITADSVGAHDLARRPAQARIGSGSTSLRTDVAVNPPSLPRVETFAKFDDFRAELESLRIVAQDLQEQNNELAKDRDLADREVRRLRKEADLLRRELREVREADPKAKLIREVLDYWVKALGKSSRTKNPANGARWNKVRARMNDGFTVDQLKQAVDGCAKVPFVGPKGRQAQEGGGAKRHDDIELICRDETTVERFIGYAKEPKPVWATEPNETHGFIRYVYGDDCKLPVSTQPAPPLRTDLPDGRLPIDKVLGALPGDWKASTSQPDCWMAQCPAHDDSGPSLSIRREQGLDGEIVLLNCFAGCDNADVVAALGLGFADLFESSVGRESGRPAKRRVGLPVHLRQALDDVRKWDESLRGQPT